MHSLPHRAWHDWLVLSPTTPWPPTTEQLAKDLAKVLTVGVGRPLRGGADKINALPLAAVAAQLSDDETLPPLRQVADAIRASIERHGPGTFWKAAALVFGVAAETAHLWKAADRRSVAATELGVEVPALKETHEPRMCLALADDLLRHLPDNDRPTTSSKGSLWRRRGSARKLTDYIAILVSIVGVVVAVVTFGWISQPHTRALPSVGALQGEASHQLSLSETPVPGTISPTLGFGDSAGGRPVFPYVNVTPTSATPVIDSIVDAPNDEGDERLFLRVAARHTTLNRIRSFLAIASEATVAHDGELVWMRLYVDNNAVGTSPGDCTPTPPSAAVNTRARMAIWDSPDKRLHVVRAWVEADNSTPKWITSAVAVVTTEAKRLELDTALSWEYAKQPGQFSSKPPLLEGAALFRSAGLQVAANGLLGSCWADRFILYLAFRQR
jgi:hypothetical protein